MLHTGDFRVSEKILSHPALFPLQNEKLEKVVLYREFDHFGDKQASQKRQLQVPGKKYLDESPLMKASEEA